MADENRRSSVLLLLTWLLCLLGGLALAGIFAAGILRDTHFGQAELPVDLGADGAWQSTDFRVWDDGPHVLWLTSLGPQPPFDPSRPASDVMDPVRFDGRLRLRIIEPDGDVRLERSYDGGSPAHEVGEGNTWTRLAELDLRDNPVRAWRLEVRVERGDAEFDTPDVTSRVLLRPDRPPAGMGGLINYVMIFPAAVLLLLSLVLGLLIAARGGSRAPAWISGVLVVVLLGLVAGR